MENNIDLVTEDSIKEMNSSSSIGDNIYSKKQKFFSELIGTTILTFVIEISQSFKDKERPYSQGSLGLIPMTYLFGKISGAHFNPAISLPMLLRQKIAIWEFIYYFLAQFLGSILGFLFTVLCVNVKYTYYNEFYSVNEKYFYLVLFLEIICSLFYVLVFFLLNIKEQKYDLLSLIVLGITFYIFNSSVIVELNPILFFPNIILGIIRKERITIIWVYFIGPIIGGIAGGFISQLFE